jgi:hypothetical protein
MPREKLADESASGFGAYPGQTGSGVPEVAHGARLFASAVFSLTFACCALADTAAPKRADEDAAPQPAVLDASALPEACFDEVERFDALLTYEVRRGPASAVFNVARRWRDGLAELLFDVRAPPAFEKWAMLLQETRSGSDDLFIYADDLTFNRVRRIPSQDMERDALFALFSAGDYRPTPRGELSYVPAPDAEIANVPCKVVIARTTHAYLGFDELELFFAAETGLLLESRFIRDGREVRRLSTTPGDYRDIGGGHRLPFHRVARRWADNGETEIVLHRAVETPGLPDQLFTKHNLLVRHFPLF